MHMCADRFLQRFDIALCLLDQLFKARIENQLLDAELLRIQINDRSQIYHHIGEDLDLTSFRAFHYDRRNRRELDLICHLACHFRTCLCDHFACQRAHRILRQLMAGDTITEH